MASETLPENLQGSCPGKLSLCQRPWYWQPCHQRTGSGPQYPPNGHPYIPKSGVCRSGGAGVLTDLYGDCVWGGGLKLKKNNKSKQIKKRTPTVPTSAACQREQMMAQWRQKQGPGSTGPGPGTPTGRRQVSAMGRPRDVPDPGWSPREEVCPPLWPACLEVSRSAPHTDTQKRVCCCLLVFKGSFFGWLVGCLFYGVHVSPRGHHSPRCCLAMCCVLM